MLSIHSHSKENSDPQISSRAKQPPVNSQQSANFQLSVRSQDKSHSQGHSPRPRNTVVRPIHDMRAHVREHNHSDQISNLEADPVLRVIAEISSMIDQLPSDVDMMANSHINTPPIVTTDSVDVSEKLTAAIAVQEQNLKLMNQEIKQLLSQYDSHGNKLSHQESHLAEYAKRVSEIHLSVTAIQDEIRSIPRYKTHVLYPELLKNTNKILIALDLSAKKLTGIAIKTVSSMAIDLLKAEVSEAEEVTSQVSYAWLKKIMPQNNAERLHRVKKQLIALYELKEQRDQMIFSDLKNGTLSFSDLISNGSNHSMKDQRKSNEATVYGQTSYGRRKIKQQQIIRTRLNVFAAEGWGVDAGLGNGQASVQTQHLAKKYRTQFLRIEKALSHFTIHKTNNPTTSMAQLLTEAVLNAKADHRNLESPSAFSDESEAALSFLDACNTLKVLQLKLFYFTDGLVRR